jgi:2-keto-4-pentenoate hydratase/2-oxohepta-3-ene-1,7-dioic acid hydratase in catechol pathway
MTPSELANLPQWTGQGFEIWFFVVLVPGSEQALWVRLTRFCSAESSDARVWAVVSDAGTVTQQRDILPLAAMTCAAEDAERFRVRVGEAELGHGFSEGRCGRISWAFRYDATAPVIERLPHLPAWLPLGTRARHPHAEAKVDGWFQLDDHRVVFDDALLTQMHLWGQRRVEWLRWAWAPQFVGADAAIELTGVAAKAGDRKLVSLWARVGELVFDRSGLAASLRAELSPTRPGVLHHVATQAGHRLVVRVWAEPETFAGWDYRQLLSTASQRDLHVAQTNLARCELELYRKSGLGWLPSKRLRASCAALEFHGLDDFAEFRYVGWDAREIAAREREPSEPAPTPAPPGPGTWIATPAPTQIVALGLTYKDHVRETASAADPVVFEIDPAAWTTDARELPSPSSQRLFDALARLDPALARELTDAGQPSCFGFMPAMFDYEVELGLVLLDGLASADELDERARAGRIGLVLANDATARSLQILGEGQADRLAYWTAAKSQPRCKPTTPRAWLPERFDLETWPAIELTTHVNGQLRQRASLELLIERPRQMLTRVLAARGPLAPGCLLLTGTPAGVAFTVPRWKRALGERLLDRVGRLRAALAGFTSTSAFLRPGDLVEQRGGFLGSICSLVTSEPEPEPR